jgi:hypothetical protein
MMEKTMGEDEFKGLEEEIDSAVDRLFVEKKREREESFLKQSAPSEPSFNTDTLLKSTRSEPSFAADVLLKSTPSEPPFDIDALLKPTESEPSFAADALLKSTPSEPPFDIDALLKPTESEPSFTADALLKSTPSEPPFEIGGEADTEDSILFSKKPPPFLKSGEMMETQLLSLEWEITKDNLENTKEEVLALRRIVREKPEIISILNLMEKVLNRMIENEESISPPLIKFLLDSKETIKLLMKNEMDREIDIYKQLAYMGIEARFFCLEGFKNIETKQPAHLAKETGKKESPMPGVEQIQQIQEMSKKMNSFLERTEGILQRMNTRLSSLEQETRKSSEQDLHEIKPLLVNITVFKVDERLFAVESEKVCRLFKVPSSFHNKVTGQEKIRLKDLEVKMIDLKKLFSIPGVDRKGKVRVLTVKDNGEYKGLMVDEVLKRLSTLSDVGRGQGEYFVGKVHWTYQQHPVEIPILDLKKL